MTNTNWENYDYTNDNGDLIQITVEKRYWPDEPHDYYATVRVNGESAGGLTLYTQADIQWLLDEMGMFSNVPEQVKGGAK